MVRVEVIDRNIAMDVWSGRSSTRWHQVRKYFLRFFTHGQMTTIQSFWGVWKKKSKKIQKYIFIGTRYRNQSREDRFNLLLSAPKNPNLPTNKRFKTNISSPIQKNLHPLPMTKKQSLSAPESTQVKSLAPMSWPAFWRNSPNNKDTESYLGISLFSISSLS